MTGRRVLLGLAQYAAVAVGQAVVAYGAQQGIARVSWALEQRKRRKNHVGF